MKLSEYVKKLEDDYAICVTYKYIATILGYTKQYISQIKNEELSERNFTKLQEHFTKIKQDKGIDTANIRILNRKEHDKINISKEYLKSINMDFKYTFACLQTNEMMQPTIFEKDIVLIDTSNNRTITDGKIYCFKNDNDYIIKRVQVLKDNSLLLLNDNNKYQSQVVSFFDMECIGLVKIVIKTLSF